MSLEIKPPGGEQPHFVDALKRVAQAGKANSLAVGAWVPNVETAQRYVGYGFTWFAVGGDAGCLIRGANELLKEARAIAKK